ncbi:hypothetical protein [Evansella cellulosilytica]|uniref:Uncharacterized protein n=1 Tax=Evansella cellulosilytica (strain ATCC 21833 / DSM 2522 / FERM P-1141 / JCM 9156 / N-4) TaxID=649639 RepID=E6TXV6_EVAC2|nr:hypothetical protein [Evansella cellulosilytica]ADU30032.1 hypothetical protein Bcell_1769 [Evansella cellulosilytica DSM 2522]
MIVKDLVETEELMASETAENVYVIYKRYENVDCRCSERSIREEIECDPEEVVQY